MIASFDLSFAAIDIVAQGLGVNARVFPFQFPSVGSLVEDRIRIAQVVRDDMTRRGLARHGDLVPEVEWALRCLGSSALSIAVVGNNYGESWYARTVADGRDAVIAVRYGEGLRFSIVRAEAMVNEVMRLLPPARPGPGQSVSITQAAAPQPAAEAGLVLSTMVRAPRTSSDAQLRAVSEILRRPRIGSGYFVVSRGSLRTPRLSWVSTDAGQYLSVSRTDDQGATHTTHSPAGNARIAHNLAEQVDWVRRA